jgi:5-methylcytosine-specific restriction endonuclease McrA
MNSHTLILTPWMTAHRIVPWETAVCLVYTGKVEVLEEYDEVIRSPSIEMQIPCIARLKKAVSAIKKGVKFSRVNVMTRDGFRCQYCGDKKPMSKLNYDHVIPRSQGGRTVWENVVTSCYPCNDKKAGRTPAQAGMKLLKLPVRPKTLPLTGPTLHYPDAPEVWAYYLGQRIAATG